MTMSRPTTRNNVENLRKQAKQFVRWHRERHWTVADTIRHTLPRFHQLTDPQIFDHEFRLADAQELIARREGFANWQALLQETARGSDATDEQSTVVEQTGPRVLVARPFVYVKDIDAACAYYTRALGFEVAFRYGAPPFYAEIERDGVRVCMRCVDTPVLDPQLSQREQLVAVSFEVRDAKALYLAFQNQGARFSQPLQTQPYGVREFTVDDPDGNRLLFFEPQRELLASEKPIEGAAERPKIDVT